MQEIGATSLPYLRRNCSCSSFVAHTSANINVCKFRLGVAKILQVYLGQLLHCQSKLRVKCNEAKKDVAFCCFH